MDINFYYNDIISGTTQSYYIDLLSNYDYIINSIVLQSDKDINNVEILINDTNIIWSGATTTINVTSGITEYFADNNNFVYNSDSVILKTSGSDLGATLIQGKIKYYRYKSISTDSLDLSVDSYLITTDQV